jgi:hypothetical protein
VSVLIATRIGFIVSQQPSPFDIILFLVWIALLLSPIFSQVSLFGVTLRKELNALRSEVKDQLINLRSEIQTSVALQAQFNPVFYLNVPGDTQLRVKEPEYRKIVEQDMKEKGIRKPSTKESITREVPEDAMFLFGVRYEIENELRRISGDMIDVVHGRGAPFLQVLRTLVDRQVLDARLAQVIRDMYSICSAAVHGGQVTREQTSFVRNLAPQLLASLKEMREY